MSQFSSPHSPPPDDPNGAPAPRRLISPQERFAQPVEAEIEAPAEAEDPFESPTSARRRDEMERRHLPPRERARQERARLDREKLMRRRAAPPSNSQRASAERASAERDFVQSAREIAPSSPRARRRAPRWLKRLSALSALLFAVWLGFTALTAPQFQVQSVEIQGLDRAPQEQVQLLSRGLVGQNLLRLDAAATERAIGLLPVVAEAKVVRLAQWPPTVALQIRERQPLLKVGAARDWWVVDALGVPFRRPAPGDAADAALYSVVAPQFAPQMRRALDAKIWARARALELALQADNRLAGAEKNGEDARFWQLRRIYFDKDGLASLRLTRAPHREMLVRLGDDAWPAKLARAPNARLF